MPRRNGEDPEVQSPGFYVKPDLYEQISTGEYLTWDYDGEKFTQTESFYDGPIKYVPLRHPPFFPLPSGPLEYPDEELLWLETKKYLHAHIDLAQPLIYDVLTAWVFANWVPERWEISPYLFFVGPLSSGKTRALEALGAISRRPILSPSMSPASMFRCIDAFTPTIFLDETEVYNRQEVSEVIGCLNSGYRRGGRVTRVENIEEGTPVLRTFDVFGFKALAGTEKLRNTLESRSIVVSMQKAVRDVHTLLDQSWAERIRNQFLTYRFKTFLEGWDPKDFLLPMFQDGRLVELFIALYNVAPSEEVQNKLLAYGELVGSLRVKEDRSGVEAQVFAAIVAIKHDADAAGRLLVQTVKDYLNRDKEKDEDKWEARTVGRKMSSLGFTERSLDKHGHTRYFLDPVVMRRLMYRYSPGSLDAYREDRDNRAKITLSTPIMTAEEAWMRNLKGDALIDENLYDIVRETPIPQTEPVNSVNSASEEEDGD